MNRHSTQYQPTNPFLALSDVYRYGFNGQEIDNKILDAATSLNAENWQYDPRIGRRWNIDPIKKDFESSYSCFLGSPIMYADPDGADAIDSKSDANESSSSSLNRPKPKELKFKWKIVRALNPNWWGKHGKQRMTTFLNCTKAFARPYRQEKPPRDPLKLIRVVDKSEERFVNQRLNVRVRNGQASDQIVNTQNGGNINVRFFIDFTITDQLLIENPLNGNGVGMDPNNNNTANDLFSSPLGPDATDLTNDVTPPINNVSVTVVSNQTRVRIVPNVNNGPNTTHYNANIAYSYSQRRTKHREYLLGVIPLLWKNSATEWRIPQDNNNIPQPRVKWK